MKKEALKEFEKYCANLSQGNDLKYSNTGSMIKNLEFKIKQLKLYSDNLHKMRCKADDIIKQYNLTDDLIWDDLEKIIVRYL